MTADPKQALRGQAIAYLKHMGWSAKDKPGWHSIIELMVAFARLNKQ